MEWEIYELRKSNNGLDYSFYNEGPRGRIRKGVQFRWMRGMGSSTYNLGFGDLKEDTDRLDDNSVSDNNDRLKVLHTVAAAVLDFLDDHLTSIVLIKARTPPRARLFQMLISSVWSTIDRQYEVYGKHGSYWIPFVKGLNYTEFIVFLKIK